MKESALYLAGAAAIVGALLFGKKKTTTGTDPEGVGRIKDETIRGKVTWLKYKSTSYYGNPSYYLEVTAKDGSTVEGQTASNSSMAYGIENSEYRKYVHTYHYHETATGNIIFDSVEYRKDLH